MNRRKKRTNGIIVVLLIDLIIIVVILTALLIYLVLKKSSSQINTQETSAEVLYNGNLYVYSSTDGVTSAIQSTERSTYCINYQQEKSYNKMSLDEINNSNFDVYYDLNGDGVQENLELIFGYDAESGTVNIALMDQAQIMAEGSLEKKLTSMSTIEVVGITNNDGIGIGVISRSFDYSADKYVLQFIVWEYYNNKFSERWNVVYTGVAASNGFMQDGYIYGNIRDEYINYSTDTHMNGYILNRSTLMSDMKNLGIYLPKDTTQNCMVEYNHYITGLLRLEVE